MLHVHIKDARRDPATGAVSAVALGDGDVPLSAIFTRLGEDGYAGFTSLETHYRLSGPMSDDVTRLPRGAAFSAGGEEASELCLRRWAEILWPTAR
jgi:sugar phosphate isomerase/epimerase